MVVYQDSSVNVHGIWVVHVVIVVTFLFVLFFIYLRKVGCQEVYS